MHKQEIYFGGRRGRKKSHWQKERKRNAKYQKRTNSAGRVKVLVRELVRFFLHWKRSDKPLWWLVASCWGCSEPGYEQDQIHQRNLFLSHLSSRTAHLYHRLRPFFFINMLMSQLSLYIVYLHFNVFHMQNCCIYCSASKWATNNNYNFIFLPF